MTKKTALEMRLELQELQMMQRALGRKIDILADQIITCEGQKELEDTDGSDSHQQHGGS